MRSVWSHLSTPDVNWSSSFEQAEWIRERLHPFGQGDIGSVIPDSFDAYIAIVHRDLRSELPAEALDRLSDVLIQHTSAPGNCWFCIWEGYAWMHGGRAVTGNPPGLVPPAVRSGGRVRLPSRSYYLYRGDVAAATTFVVLPWDLRPNLWWPDDRAWCVATEIDNVATYVGGTAELAAALRATPRSVPSQSRLPNPSRTEGIISSPDHP
jgi:hypothetical protein